MNPLSKNFITEMQAVLKDGILTETDLILMAIEFESAVRQGVPKGVCVGVVGGLGYQGASMIPSSPPAPPAKRIIKEDIRLPRFCGKGKQEEKS